MLEFSKTIRKKFTLRFLAAAAVLSAAVLLTCLIYGWVISGKAALTFRRLQFEISNGWESFTHPSAPLYVTDGLKPGKYLLQREWGLDETDYVEVFDDGTLRLVGEYWIEKRNEDLAADPDCYNHKGFVDRTERTPYELNEVWPLVEFPGAGSGGFSYIDENTLVIGRDRDEINDVNDFNHEPDDPDTPRYNEDSVVAHYIYAEP